MTKYVTKYAIKIERTGTHTQTNFHVRVPRFLDRAGLGIYPIHLKVYLFHCKYSQF